MAVTTDIMRTWRGPRTVMRDLLNHGQREDRALAYLMAACIMIFIAQWPRLSRIAAGVIAIGRLPILWLAYDLAAHVLRYCGGCPCRGQGIWRAGRLVRCAPCVVLGAFGDHADGVALRFDGWVFGPCRGVQFGWRALVAVVRRNLD